MSLVATRWAWGLKLSTGQKMVLLSLADRADDSGRSWPSLARMAADTGISERNVYRHINALEDLGLLCVSSVPGKGRNYQLAIGASGKSPTVKAPPLTPCHPTPDTMSPLTPCHPCHDVTPPLTPCHPTPDMVSIASKYESTIEPTKNLSAYSASAPLDAGSSQSFLSGSEPEIPQPPEPENYLTRKRRKLTGKRLQAFNRFWRDFAYGKGKAEAADAWLDIPHLTNSLVNRICAAARREAAARPQLVAMGRSPKWAQGWLTARRWEDEEEPPPEVAGNQPDPEEARRLLDTLFAPEHRKRNNTGASP